LRLISQFHPHYLQFSKRYCNNPSILIQKAWIPETLIHYCFPLDLFKCTYPSDLVMDSYYLQIQQLTTVEIVKALEESNMMAASEVYKTLSKKKNSGFRSFFGINRDKGERKEGEENSIYGAALEDVILSDMHGQTFQLEVLDGSGKKIKVYPKVPVLLLKCTDFIAKNGGMFCFYCFDFRTGFTRNI
jgi:hypothetical protein